MTHDDARLRALLLDAAPAADPLDPDLLVRRAQRRRAVRWSGAALAGLVVVGAAGAGVALTRDSHRQPAQLGSGGVDLAGTVPWVDLPAGTYQPPPSTAPAAATTAARACTASDVSAAVDGRDGAGGHLVTYVVFRNTSSTPCLLDGYPQGVAREPGRPDVTADHSTFFPQSTSADMAPGATTLLGLETDSLCPARPGGGGGQPPYHAVDLTLPGGGTVPVAFADGLDVTCGLHLTHFYVEQKDPVVHEPLDDLTASLEVPQAVGSDGTLVYVVDLTNPTGAAIALDRLGGYVEGPGKESHALNPAVTSIAAGQTVRFEMRLHAPGPAPFTVTWSLLGPLDVSARADVG